MSSLTHPPPGSEVSETEKLYFAYGSNMYLPQMAVRCCDSMLFGKGILRNYRWQTNSLGGGNVVDSGPEDFVEGILFTVSASDVQTLRRYEGIAWQYFVEKEVDVEVEPVSETALGGRSLKPADVAEFLTHHNSEFNLKLAEPNSTSDAAIQEQNPTQSNSTIGGTSKTEDSS